MLKQYLALGIMFFAFSQLSLSQSKPHQLLFGVLDILPMVNITKNKVDEDKPGLIIELLWLLEKQINIKLEFQTCPTKRCFVMLGQGKIDGMPIASYSPDRAKHFGAYPMLNGKVDTRRKIFDSSYVLYKLNSSSLNWNGDEFIGIDLSTDFRIGVNLGFSVAKFLEGRGIAVLENNSTLANMDMLLAGRVAGVAVFKSLGHAILKRDKKYNSIVMLPKPLISKPYYIILSHQFVKNNPKLANSIWSTSAIIGSSDEYKNLMGKYLN